MLTLKSPAKINWCLRVIGKRNDGYHDLWTVMQKINLFDMLQFRVLEKDIKVHTDSLLEIGEKENLVYRAAKKLKEKTGYRGGVEIALKKNIPAQAGLGGGSSNAAYTLMGLNELWRLGLSRYDLIELASELGSDVPFFLIDGIGLVEGKGDRVRSLGKGKEERWLLLVKPPFGVSTKEAYGRLKNYTQKIEKPEKIVKGIVSGSIEDVVPHVVNDLESAVFQIYPELQRIKERLIKEGALCALLSGSGSTVFGLFRSKDDAVSASYRFDNLWVRVVSTVN